MSIKDPNGKLARWAILLQTFDFEIIHRAGKKHANVEALSRINNVKISEEKYDDDSKEKDLDPYEDEILLHYLKEGKFLPGSSKKQCKRAQNNAKHLVWSENILYYHSDPEDQSVLKMIPRKENRINLVKEAHGFVGVMVITEYLTKYPYAVPIKSKSAVEIGSELFKFIALFGLPKEILSDQGKEFLNSVVDQTSIYHPRTNGLTERFNQTMVSALRKHAETQELDWDKWLPFILLAYRSRVQKSTKYTPYELMFGRKINSLSNWSDNGVDYSSDIIKRAAEIRKLHEISIPEALKNIELAQKVQKKVQDTKSNVKEETLDVNSKVFVRMPKIQGKLEQIYKGPFKIEKITPKHNYVLRNSKNKLLKGSFTLNKLKPISTEVADEIGSDEVDAPEIEKILKSRIKLDKKEYYIKFKDEDKPIWVPENKLTSLEEVDEYNNNLGKTSKINLICKINGKSIWLGKWPFIIGIWLALVLVRV